MSESAARIVSVEIQGLRYPIKSSLDAAYVADLAAYVDGKMRAAADETPAGDSVKVAVIAALNVADELFRCREGEEASGRSVRDRVEDIERLIDEAIARARA
jgi:cell division protein ZapA